MAGSMGPEGDVVEQQQESSAKESASQAVETEGSNAEAQGAPEGSKGPLQEPGSSQDQFEGEGSVQRPMDQEVLEVTATVTEPTNVEVVPGTSTEEPRSTELTKDSGEVDPINEEFTKEDTNSDAVVLESTKHIAKELGAPRGESNGSEGSEDGKKIDLVMNATELLQKLEIQESSDGCSNGDDDATSSIESTANSGAIHSQDDKAVSGEDGDEGTSRRKKRIDLRHHFVRDIVKIQHDRDQYERQCQIKKQEESSKNPLQTPRSNSSRQDPDRFSSISGSTKRSVRRSSAQGTPRTPVLCTPTPLSGSAHWRSDGPKRQLSSVDFSRQDAKFQTYTLDLHDKGKVQPQTMPIYRPPNRRDVDIECIQVRGLPIPTKLKIVEPTKRLPENLKITFGTQGREVTELLHSNESESKEQLFGNKVCKDGNNLPPSFEFKATAVGMQMREDTSPDSSRRHRRNSQRSSLSASSSQSFPVSEPGSTPRSNSDRSVNGALEVNARRLQRPEAPSIYPLEDLPPKDKPFAGEDTNNVKWSDIVDSEAEPSPTFKFGSEPDNAVNHWSKGIKQKKHRHKKKDKGKQDENLQTSPHRDSNSNKEPARKSVWERLGREPVQGNVKNRSITNSIDANTNKSNRETEKKSVWERLGGVEALETNNNSCRKGGGSRAVYYDMTTRTTSRLEVLRMPSEREYYCKDGEAEFGCGNAAGDVVVEAAAAYKDAKQKRSRLELYVPRRGGNSQLPSS